MDVEVPPQLEDALPPLYRTTQHAPLENPNQKPDPDQHHPQDVKEETKQEPGK